MHLVALTHDTLVSVLAPVRLGLWATAQVTPAAWACGASKPTAASAHSAAPLVASRRNATLAGSTRRRFVNSRLRYAIKFAGMALPPAGNGVGSSLSAILSRRPRRHKSAGKYESAGRRIA